MSQPLRCEGLRHSGPGKLELAKTNLEPSGQNHEVRLAATISAALMWRN